MEQSRQWSWPELVEKARSGNWSAVEEGILSEQEKLAPYASLVHILRAIKDSDAELRFRAAIFSPERGRLRELAAPIYLEQPSPIAQQEEAKSPAPHQEQILEKNSEPAEEILSPVQAGEQLTQQPVSTDSPLIEEREALPQNSILPHHEPQHMTPTPTIISAHQPVSTPVPGPKPPLEDTSTSMQAPVIRARNIALLGISVFTPENRTGRGHTSQLSIPVTNRDAAFHQGIQDFVQEQMSRHSRSRERLRAQLIPFRSNDQELISRFLADPAKAMKPSFPMSHHQPTEQPWKASISTDDNLVTETLARLHVRQNHPEEAIRIYEQLSLRYPEKKAYFAAQIKHIKEDKL